MNTKKELLAALGGKVSPTAAVCEDGHWAIKGKYGYVALNDDGSFDVWLTDTSSPAAILSSRKLTAMMSGIEKALGTVYLNRKDGEAWGTIASAEDVLKLAPILKFRMKRRVSDGQMWRLQVHLAKANAEREAARGVSA